MQCDLLKKISKFCYLRPSRQNPLMFNYGGTLPHSTPPDLYKERFVLTEAFWQNHPALQCPTTAGYLSCLHTFSTCLRTLKKYFLYIFNFKNISLGVVSFICTFYWGFKVIIQKQLILNIDTENYFQFMSKILSLSKIWKSNQVYFVHSTMHSEDSNFNKFNHNTKIKHHFSLSYVR